MSTFEQELEKLINEYSQENASNTLDFILAQYLVGCLNVFSTTMEHRDRWYRLEGSIQRDLAPDK